MSIALRGRRAEPGESGAPPDGVRGLFHTRVGDKVRCDVCPRLCTLAEGQRGFCFVRQAAQGDVWLTSYGRASGFCIDPIEKKPLAHFHPGTSVLSFGTAGCNLGCKFCQNWDISKARTDDRLGATASPEAIARAARDRGCTSVAFTYNDPVIFAEYAIDTALACREVGIRSVAVSAGYATPSAGAALFGAMDAANVDLKAFSERFYRKLCLAHLAPVLETLELIHRETNCWLEITTLVIPGENDGDAELAGLCEWIASRLGPDVPLHFTAFHPDYQLTGTGPTPLATLERAKAHGRRAGLRFVYTGNVVDADGHTTRCATCGVAVIERNGYEVTRYALDGAGCCRACGAALPGRFSAEPGHWGSRRLPVLIRS